MRNQSHLSGALAMHVAIIASKRRVPKNTKPTYFFVIAFVLIRLWLSGHWFVYITKGPCLVNWRDGEWYSTLSGTHKQNKSASILRYHGHAGHKNLHRKRVPINKNHTLFPVIFVMLIQLRVAGHWIFFYITKEPCPVDFHTREWDTGLWDPHKKCKISLDFQVFWPCM